MAGGGGASHSRRHVPPGGSGGVVITGSAVSLSVWPPALARSKTSEPVGAFCELGRGCQSGGRCCEISEPVHRVPWSQLCSSRFLFSFVDRCFCYLLFPPLLARSVTRGTHANVPLRELRFAADALCLHGSQVRDKKVRTSPREFIILTPTPTPHPAFCEAAGGGKNETKLSRLSLPDTTRAPSPPPATSTPTPLRAPY